MDVLFTGNGNNGNSPRHPGANGDPSPAGRESSFVFVHLLGVLWHFGVFCIHGFPFVSQSLASNEKHEERENKSVMDLGFQLFRLPEKVQEGKTIPLFMPEGRSCLRVFAVIFLDRKRDISSFLSPKICCSLWLPPSHPGVHLGPPGAAKPFPSPALSYSHQRSQQKEAVTQFFIPAVPGMPRDSIPAVFRAAGKGAAQRAPAPGNCFSSPCGTSFRMSLWIKPGAAGFTPDTGGLGWALGKTLVMGPVKHWNKFPGNGAATMELCRMDWDEHP